MKIKVQIGTSDSTVLVLPSDAAGVLAAMLAGAEVFEREGYTSPPIYKPAAGGISFDFVSDSVFAKPSDELIEARKEAERKNSQWYDEYKKVETLTRELREANAALETLKSAQVCRAPVSRDEE